MCVREREVSRESLNSDESYLPRSHRCKVRGLHTLWKETCNACFFLGCLNLCSLTHGFLNPQQFKRSILVASGLLFAMVALAGLRSNVQKSASWNEISSPSSLLQDIMRVHPESEEIAHTQELFEVKTAPRMLNKQT